MHFSGDNLRKWNLWMVVPFIFSFCLFPFLFWSVLNHMDVVHWSSRRGSILHSLFSYHCTSFTVPQLQSFPAFPPLVLNHALTLTWTSSHKKLSVLKVWLLIPVTQNPHAEMRNDKGLLGPDSHLTYLGFPKG